jgi:hypothetical protein
MTAKSDSYDKLVKSGKARHRRHEILAFMALHTGRTFTRAELAEQIPMRLSTVCGQIHPLLQEGEVITVGRRPCTVTGEKVNELRLRQLF